MIFVAVDKTIRQLSSITIIGSNGRYVRFSVIHRAVYIVFDQSSTLG